MLSQAAEKYSEFAKQVSDDPDLELERGRTLKRLGDMRRLMLNPDAASAAYRQAIDVFSSLYSKHPDFHDAAIERANVMGRQAVLAMDTGKYDEAAKIYSAALVQLGALKESNADHIRLTSALVDNHVNFGWLLTMTRDLERAEDHLNQAIDLQTAMLRAAPTNIQLNGPLADARMRLGKVLLERGDVQSALDKFNQSITLWDQLVQLQPDNPEPRQSRAIARIASASAQRLVGSYRAEADSYRGAVADYEALIAALPDAPVYRENLALTQTDLGQLLYELGQPHEAVDVLTKAKDQLTQLADSYRDFVRFQEEIAVCLDNLGQAQLDVGRLADALASHQEAEKILSNLAGEFPEVTEYQERHATNLSHLGQVQAAMANMKPGLESLQSAIQQLKQLHTLQPKLPSVLSALAATRGKRADILLEDRQKEPADEAYQSAIQTCQETIVLSPSAEYLHRAAFSLTMCSSEKARNKELALDFARRAVDAAPENGLYLGTLAAAQYRAGQPQSAVELFTRSLAMDGGDRGRDLLFLAMCHQELGHHDEARATLSKATDWIAQHRPGNPPLKRLAAEVARFLDGEPNDSVPAKNDSRGESSPPVK
jgi:tetratricopeptide (TPR) repeat protein